MDCGIYSILNRENGKIYVGQSVNIDGRFRQHKSELRRNLHTNSHLQSSWNKYGENSFEFNVLEHCDESHLDDNEKWWISYFDSTDRLKGYNKTIGGDFNPMKDPSIAKKVSNSTKGRNLGVPRSEETRRKISESLKGENSPLYGKSRSLESCIHQSRFHNTTGYFRVTIMKKSDCKQGYYYRYQYFDGDKRKSFNSVDLEKLKDKVISHGLEWRKL